MNEFEFLSDLTSQTGLEVHGSFAVGGISCKFQGVDKLS